MLLSADEQVTDVIEPLAVISAAGTCPRSERLWQAMGTVANAHDPLTPSTAEDFHR